MKGEYVPQSPAAYISGARMHASTSASVSEREVAISFDRVRYQTSNTITERVFHATKNK